MDLEPRGLVLGFPGELLEVDLDRGGLLDRGSRSGGGLVTSSIQYGGWPFYLCVVFVILLEPSRWRLRPNYCFLIEMRSFMIILVNASLEAGRLPRPCGPAAFLPLLATSASLIFLTNHQGNTNEVETLFKRALAIREQALVRSHPDVVKTRNNLAGLVESEVKLNAHLPKIFFHLELVAYII